MVKDNTFFYVETKNKAKKLNRQEIVAHLREAINELKEKTVYRNEYVEGFKAKENLLKAKPEEPWVFSPSLEIKNKILGLKNAVKLGQLCDVSQGVTVGGEGCLEIFLVSGSRVKVDDETLSLETDVVKPVIGGINVKRWSIEWNNQMLVYPYDTNGNSIELGNFNEGTSAVQIKRQLDKLIATGEVRHPNTAKYLIQFFHKLATREFESKPLSSYGKKWFELHRSRDASLIGAREKIVCPRMMEKNRFALDENGFFVLDSCMAVALKKRGKELDKTLDKVRSAFKESDDQSIKLMLLKYILGILNSSITELLMKLSVPFLQGRYFQISESFLSDIPIMIPKQPELIKNVILTVDSLLKGEKIDEKLNRTIYNFYEITNKEKIAEIEEYISTH